MKNRANHSIVGKRVPKYDAIDKVTGRAKYTSDIKTPEMIHGKILRSPHPHAKILSISTSKAEKLPGVIAVITGKDIPFNRGMIGVTINDMSVLEDRKVRFIGDAVAAVVAESEETAERALELIDVKYEPLPGVFDTEEAVKLGSPEVHDGVKNNIASDKWKLICGNVEKGFNEADYIFEDKYETQPVEQAPLERESAVASYEPGGFLTIWATSQGPYVERAVLSRILKIPQHKIRILCSHIGGSYGSRLGIRVLYICAASAMKVGGGRPIRMVNSREEEFTCSTIRHPIIFHLKTGVKKDGTLTAVECKYIVDNGAYTDYGELIPWWIGLSSFASYYKCPNRKWYGTVVYTNNPFGGAYRGFGDPQFVFAMEQQMDVMAEKLRIDPLEIRLKNIAKLGDMIPTYSKPVKLSSCGLEDSIRRVADAIGWKEKMGRYIKTGTKVRAMGIACGAHGTSGRIPYDSSVWRTGKRVPQEVYTMDKSSPFIVKNEDGTINWRFGFEMGPYDADPSYCILRMNDDGTINLQIGEVDYGQGASTTLAMIVAEELGVKLEDIKVESGDTAWITWGLGTAGSRVTLIGGKAVQNAAKEAKKILFNFASEMLEARPEDLEARDGKIYVKGTPDKFVYIQDAAYRAYSTRNGGYIITRGYFDPDTTIETVCAAWIFYAQGAEIELDTETGEIQIVNMASAFDCGNVINPVGAEGQVEGGTIQGIGYATTEKLIWEKGRTLNPNFLKYTIPSAQDVSSIKPIFANSHEPKGPYGAKGLGEAGMCPMAAAVANAVYNAAGVRIKKLPITPEEILKALREKGTTSNS